MDIMVIALMWNPLNHPLRPPLPPPQNKWVSIKTTFITLTPVSSFNDNITIVILSNENMQDRYTPISHDKYIAPTPTYSQPQVSFHISLRTDL